MDDTGRNLVETAVGILAVALAVFLPLITVWRLRKPEQRRDAWLGANAQPVLTVVASGVWIVGFLFSGLGCAIAAIYFERSLAWAPVVVAAGGIVATILSTVLSFRMPADVE